MADRRKWTRERRDEENARKRIRGAELRRERKSTLPPYKPRVPRGPQSPPKDPYIIPDGHELGGLSSLADGTGNVQQAWHKSRVAGAEPTPIPEGFEPTKIARYSRGDGSVIGEWKSFEPAEAARIEAVTAAWKRHADMYRGLAGSTSDVDPDTIDHDLAVVIPIGDPHIGMLAWPAETSDAFDTKIACRELLVCVRELIRQAPPAPKLIIGNLGDALHAQDDMQRTPGHGHKLDVDGRFAKVLDATHTLFRGLVDEGLKKFGHVSFRNLPGNHDPRVAVELAMWLEAVFERDPRVTIEPAHRAHQYDRHGKVLIGWHHGDRSKPANLPEIMARDHSGAGTGWYGETCFHRWLVGHVHHKTVRESPAGIVETFNTLAAQDAWHAGAFRSERFLQAISYHREFGEHSRSTVSIERVRAALAAQKAA